MQSITRESVYVDHNTKTAIGIMLLGGGIAAGSFAVAALGCLLLPLRKLVCQGWRPSKSAL